MENQNENLVSLFDYLGKAAGSVLGKQVYQAAKEKKVGVVSKNITTKSYTGSVLMYPKTFLEEYFGPIEKK